MQPSVKKNNYIPTKHLTRREWLELRKKIGIGGSEVSAVLGYNSYKTAVDVWIDKTSATLIDSGDTPALWIGRYIEPMIRARFAEEKGLRVFQDHKIRLHPDHDCLFCNLDGVIIDPDEGPGVFEAKAFLSYTLDKYESVIPPDVYLQIQHNMSVTGYGYGYAAIWIKDRNEFLFQRINRNDKLIADINKRCVRFWEYNVQGYHAPAPVSEDDLRKLYNPGSEGKTKVANETIYDNWAELNRARAEQKALKNKEDMLRFQIENFMEDAEVLKDKQGDVLATWKTSNSFDEALLKDEEPGLYEQYCTKFDKEAFKKNHAAKYSKYMYRNGARKFLPKTK